MASTLSSNMNLIIPTVGQEPGPTYAFDLNASLTLIDSHDHSPGRGVQITPAGLNINTDLSIESNSLTDVLTLVFGSSASASTTAMSLSVAPGGESPQQQDLWYTPDTGVPIQITKNGQVNVVASSIEGESYAAGTFFWTQAQDSLPTTPANFDIGSITIRPTTPLTAFGVKLNPNSGISSQYDINLPLLPVSTSFLTLDSSGNMNASIPIANGITAANIANQTITATQIANQTITGAQIADHTITSLQLAASTLTWNVDQVTSSGTFTVPADVNLLYILASGGGGGAGGGSFGSAGGNAGQGGAGGAGATPTLVAIQVTPAEVLTVTIPAAAAGGSAGTSGGTAATDGASGGTVTITGTGVNLRFLGGPGGVHGASNISTSTTFTADTWQPAGPLTGSGFGGGFVAVSGTTHPGGNGSSSNYADGGTGGTSQTSSARKGGGGGGGGGAGLGNGGTGGNGLANLTAGTAGSAGGLGAGGGGGGAGSGSNNVAGGAGGNGGSGYVYIYWLGNP